MTSTTNSLQVNDVHSGLNACQVAEIVVPSSEAGIASAIRRAAERGIPIAICGGRHAMGGQQFGTGAVLLDMSRMDRIISFNPKVGLVEVEAGIQWPALIDYLELVQDQDSSCWAIRQKQTGADTLSIGGCLSANVHGRGLAMKPFIDDVEAFVLIDADGRTQQCSRRDNPQLFALAIGGYGMFGVITSVTLRLARRRKMRRDVRLLQLDALMAAFDARVADGYVYGDFQFAIDPASSDFLNTGVFSCYVAVDNATPTGEDDKHLSDQDWSTLLELAHTHKQRAFEHYAAHYLATDGQVYWSDRLQQATYLDGYHQRLDGVLGHCGSEMIGELYVPRQRLADFMRAAAADFRAHGVDLIYGTIRLIQRDVQSFMPWARQDYACVIFNLHTHHDAAGIEAMNQAFRRLNDLAIARGGSFYLTYSKAASMSQLLTCYPNFGEFLELKRQHDPGERFQSNWYRHYRDLFAASGLEHAA